MKKFIFLALIVSALTGCKDESGFTVTDYKVINLIEADIVVELGIKDRRETTIKSGEIRTIHSDMHHYMGNRPESSMSHKVLDLLEPEMKIDGKIVPEFIWMIAYWKYDGSDVYNPAYFNGTYTLIVTDKFLETVNSQSNNENQDKI